MKITTHSHPRPTINRLSHTLAFILLVVIVFSVPLQVVLAILLRGSIFLITALLTGLLALPVVMVLFATPTVTISEEGLRIEPTFGRAQIVSWEAVRAFERYPLLPLPDQEIERRALVGRKKYQAAVGKMLTIEGLPVMYRVTGFFAGVSGKPVIAITNRTHTGYEYLVEQISQHVKETDS